MNGTLFSSKLKLKTKLQLSFLIIGFLSIVAISWQAFENARSAIESITFDRLTSIRETKKRQIESYFQQIRNQVITLSEDKMVVEAMSRFTEAFFRIDVNDRETLGKQLRLPGGNAIVNMYRSLDTVYRPSLESYRRRFGYDDVFLVEPDSGYVVFSTVKKYDFAKSLLHGEFQKTNLASVFTDARRAQESGLVKLVDFAPYPASNDAPVSFIASPIRDNGKLFGVLVFQIPISLINQVMTSNKNWQEEGLGETGETYIVGSDFTMRTDSRFFIQDTEQYFARLRKIGVGENTVEKIRSFNTSILIQEVRSDATRDALAGNTNTKIISDYRGVPVISSYTPLRIPGVTWVMIAEIDVSEAFGPVLALRERLILLGLVILFLSALAGMLISRSISKPILALKQATEQFGKGNPSFDANIHSLDEIGELARAFDIMAESITRNTTQLQNEIGERRRAEEEVTHSHTQLRNLSAHLQTVREEERKGLAREIHDELGQALTTLKLNLALLKGDLYATSAEASDKIAPMLTLIDTTIKSVKRMIAALRPRLLDDLGLTAAIEWQAEEFQERTTIQCSLSISPAEITLDGDRSIAIFRIFQETLTNIARHAKATKINVTLTDTGEAVVLEVKDNGIGIKKEQVTNSRSFGLMGIRERASYWGGDAIIEGLKNEGTSVRVRFPHHREGYHD